jgi:hypothetical protein
VVGIGKYELMSSKVDWFIKLLAVTILIFQGNIWSVTYFIPIQAEITEESEIILEPSNSIHEISSPDSNHVVILNSTPFSGPPEWRTRSYGTLSHGLEVEEGYYFEMRPRLFEEDTFFVEFYHPFCISLPDYETVRALCSIEMISG